MSPKPPLHNIALKVVGFTALWALPLFVVLALSATRAFGIRVPYATYVSTIWAVGPLLVLTLLLGAYRASKFIPPKSETVTNLHWYQDGVLVALLVFWALAPPSYFFVEYYAFDEGFVEWRKPCACLGNLKAVCLAEIKIYSDLASKFWAGAGAVLVALVALAKNAA